MKFIVVYEVYIASPLKLSLEQNAIKYKIFAVNRILAGSNAPQTSRDKPVNYYFDVLVTEVTLE